MRSMFSFRLSLTCICFFAYATRAIIVNIDYWPGCGRASTGISPVSRIVGGRVTSPTHWPWNVAIREQGRFICSGTIIRPYWILTVAHCFNVARSRVADFRVITGEYDLTRADSLEREYNISRIHSHIGYDSVSGENDIALVRLTAPITYDVTSRPICLPASGHAFTNRTCVVVGWGDTQGGGNMNLLTMVELRVWARLVCRAVYEPMRYSIFDSNVCAGGRAGQDACWGDSGGPLMCMSDNRWYLAGLVAWGVECAVPGYPGVYTRASSFAHWINAIQNGERRDNMIG